MAASKDINMLFAALARAAPALEEAASRPLREVKVVDETHVPQAAFINDPATMKVVLCTRRSGKSMGAGLYLVKEALENPGVSVLYVGLTRGTAKRVMWKDVFKAIDKKFALDMVFNETELSVTLQNGSVIYLLGMDASPAEMEKSLGQKFKLVVIDEAASYSIDLNTLVYGVLKPAVADYRGTICLIGTPSGIKRGLFYTLTAGQNPGECGRWETKGWSGHKWSALDNPYMRANWIAEIEELKKANPRIEETPLFKRNYRGQWTNDESNQVYKYDAERNAWNGVLPEYEHGAWHHVLGVDLGWNDPTSFTVLAYHDHDPNTYIRRSWKEAKLTLTQVAGHIGDLDEEFHFDSMIVDGAAKQSVEELKRIHQLPLEAAMKTGEVNGRTSRLKADFIEIMNDAFLLGRIKVDVDQCVALIDEWADLLWDMVPSIGENGETVWVNKQGANRQEHPGCENHCSDGASYAYRKVYAYLAEAYTIAPKPGTQAWLAKQFAEYEERKCAEIEQAKRDEQEAIEDLAWT